MKNFLAKIIFLIHSAVVIFWLGLLFVPVKWWPGKLNIELYLTLIIVYNQLIWGLIITPWTKKYRMVCFLTTINQLLRGKAISDEKNYDHSFIQEFLGLAKIKVPHRFAIYLTFTIFTIVLFQYFSSVH